MSDCTGKCYVQPTGPCPLADVAASQGARPPQDGGPVILAIVHVPTDSSPGPYLCRVCAHGLHAKVNHSVSLFAWLHLNVNDKLMDTYRAWQKAITVLIN